MRALAILSALSLMGCALSGTISDVAVGFQKHVAAEYLAPLEAAARVANGQCIVLRTIQTELVQGVTVGHDIQKAANVLNSKIRYFQANAYSIQDAQWIPYGGGTALTVVADLLLCKSDEQLLEEILESGPSDDIST